MTKTFPTLFSRSVKGATEQWTVMVDGDKWRTESGQVGGALTLTKWTVCKPKNVGRANETTPAEQALSEAEARWDKKMKTGYTNDPTKIDTCLTYIKPMLAEELDDYLKKINFATGVLVQNKYNGVRCVATLEDGRVILKSRKGELWISVPHINKDLEKFFAKFPDAVLDGELYNYDLRQKLNELTSIVRKTKEKSITPALLKQSEEMVRFYVYDGYDFNADTAPSVSYIERKAWIDANLPKYSKYYRQVPTFPAYAMDEVEKIYQGFLDDGEEGAIVRMPTTGYEFKRSKNLLKYKPEYDDEGIIRALHEGTGDWVGTAKTATVEWRGKMFTCTFKGTLGQGAERLKNPKPWLNTLVTFTHIGISAKNGVPNSGRIDPDNCFKGDR